MKTLMVLALAVWLGGQTMAQDKKIRQFLTTGPWYPADAAELAKEVAGCFKQAKQVQVNGRVAGLVAPHAGFAYSGRTAATAYGTLGGSQAVTRVILLGTSHRAAFTGAVVSDFDYFATPLGQIAVDVTICKALAQNAHFKLDNRVMQAEHSLENHLPFLQQALAGRACTLVPIMVGMADGAEIEALAAALRPYVDDTTVVCASTDLTHYGDAFGFTPFRNDIAANLEQLDRGYIDAVLALDLQRSAAYCARTGITACGTHPVAVLMALMAGIKAQGSLAEYTTSGAQTGDYSHCVSYAALVFSVPGAADRVPPTPALTHAEQQTLLQIARATLQGRLKSGVTPGLADGRHQLTAALKQRLGVFVTLHHGQELRGCIGTISGGPELAEAVQEYAVHAALDDPRFNPVTLPELSGLTIEISVMTPLQPLADYKQIRLGTDGVIIRDGMRQAVFLPQVASETGWHLDEFLANLCRKAGLPADAYARSKTMQFTIFQAQVFAEQRH
jgi:MEMO1 family protein